MDNNELSPELLEKLKAAKTPEEIIALAKEEGYSLTDKELDQISGGISWDPCACDGFRGCPERKSKEPTDGRD